MGGRQDSFKTTDLTIYSAVGQGEREREGNRKKGGREREREGRGGERKREREAEREGETEGQKEKKMCEHMFSILEFSLNFKYRLNVLI